MYTSINSSSLFTFKNCRAMEIEWVRGPELGRGSFATVHLAIPRCRNSQSPPLMVAKSCHTSSASATLRNEKMVLDQIGACPFVIRCFGEAQSNLLLEYASGGSLADRVKNSGGKLPEREVRRYARSMLEGLFHVHDRGFVHCDVKLDNVLVFGNGDAKIADFGLAKKAGERSRFELRGTPLYMSPESVNGNECESPADIWAVGCAVLEMITGKAAWSDSNIWSLIMRIGAGSELPEIPRDLSEEGKDFLGRILVKDPRKRWSAEELLGHPFVSDQPDTIKFAEESPRDPFDFPEWGLEKEEEKVYSGECPSVRIRDMFCDESIINWSVSESWVTIR